MVPEHRRSFRRHLAWILLVTVAVFAVAGCTQSAPYRDYETTSFPANFQKTDGNTIFMGAWQGSFIQPANQLYRVDSGKTTCITCGMPYEGAYGGEPSPDGRWYLFWIGPFQGPSDAERTAGAGATQLYVLDMTTYELTQLTNESYNRVAFWSPDGQHIYWTKVLPDSTYHMWEGRFSVTAGIPQLEPTREMIPQVPQETPAQKLGVKYAWYEAKQATDQWMYFASTVGESGNSDIWAMHRETLETVRLTTDPEYEEMVTASPDDTQIAFSSSKAYDQMKRLVPFSPGPSLLDAYIVVPILVYALYFQVVPVVFEPYLMNRDGSDPIRISETGEQGWQWAGVTWSPDSSQLLFSESTHPSELRDFFGVTETRTTLMSFANKDSAPWPALDLARSFDPETAEEPTITFRNVAPVTLPPAKIDELVNGSISGTAHMYGSIDLDRSFYDVTIVYDGFLDAGMKSAITGQGRAFIKPGTSLLTTEMGFDLDLRRENGDQYVSHLYGKGYEVEASCTWLVDGQAGEYDVTFP